MLQQKRNLWGLIALSLIMFMVTLDTTITNIALPDITNYFKSSLTDTNWISTIYVLVMSVAIIPASKLGDQFGRKKLMAIGLIIFGLGSLLCGFSNNLNNLIIMRFIQGIGGAIVTPIMIPLSVDLFGRKKANKAVGIIGAVTAVAAAAGPPIGGLILKFLNWQWIFFVNIPIVIITFILLLICFEESFDTTISKKIDFGGGLFLTLSLSQLTFLLVKGYDMGWSSKFSRLLMIGSIIAFILFIVTERIVKEPLIELGLFKEITFSASALIYFMCGFTIVCSSLIFNFFLENVRGYSALDASYIIMFMSITVMLSMPLGSKLVDYLGYRIIITTGMILITLSLFLLTTLSPSTSKQTMIGYMMILGFGFGFACLSIVSAVQFVPESKAGIASGIVNAARQLGTCLGIALLVGTMSHNVDMAKKNIKNQAAVEVTSKKLPSNISDLINDSIAENISSSNIKNNSNFQAILKRDINKALKKVYEDKTPNDNNLKKIHDGINLINKQFSDESGTISAVAKQITNDQKKLMIQNSAVLYQLVKDNGNAGGTLSTYRNEYAKLSSQSGANNKDKLQKIAQMIIIYEVGTNPEVKDATEFNDQINKLYSNNKQESSNRRFEDTQVKLSSSLSSKGVLRKQVTKLNLGVYKMDLGERIGKLLQDIKNIKNNLLTKAFTDTFKLSALIIMMVVPVGLFTDRRFKNKTTSN